MSRHFFLIIFVLWAAWQLVGSLVEKAGKKQQDQRLKELTAQRQRQLAAQAGRPAGAGLSGGGGAEGPRGTGVADRLEGLAARRKAQLEELRRRRTARHPGTAQQGSPPVVLRPTRTPMSTPGMGRSFPTQRAPQPVPIARSAPPVRRVPRQPPVPPTTAPPPTPPVGRGAPLGTPAQRVVTPEVRRKVQPEPRLGPHSVFAHTKKISTAPSRRRRPAVHGGEPIDRALLRKMIVYREILDPPLALRAEQVWER